MKELDYKKFAFIMVAILFVEYVAAHIFWNATGFMLAMLGWKVLFFIYFFVYVQTLNKVCIGDNQVSNNAFVIAILGMITFSIYCFYWIHKQSVRMQDRAQEWRICLSDYLHKTKFCLIPYWVVAYLQSKVLEPYQLYGELDIYGLLGDKRYMFYDFMIVAILLLLAYWMTRDLNLLVEEYNRKGAQNTNREELSSTITMSMQSKESLHVEDTNLERLSTNNWFCTQCGSPNKAGIKCCTQCGKFR